VSPSVPAPSRVEPVALRVSDLAASREFFQSLFGLQPAHGPTLSHASVVLVSPTPGHEHFTIRLTTDPVPIQLLGIHVELENINELLDLYFLALLGGHRTSELRFRHGSLSTTITDPDGHSIEVEAHYGIGSAGARGPSRLGRRVPGRGAGVPSAWDEAVPEPQRTTPAADTYPVDRSCAPGRLAR
jgi:catechol 2,3-dioxygenase-like lactoylglutathione lyase family enzyme